MDPVRAGTFGQFHDGLHVEKALHGVGADAMRLVGLLHVDGSGVALRVDRDGPDSELPAGADDAHGDLAAVGDEDSLKHSPSENATEYHRAREQVEGPAGRARGLQQGRRDLVGVGARHAVPLPGYWVWISTIACELPPPVTTLTRVSPGLIAGTVASTVVSFTYLNEILALSAMDPKETPTKHSFVPKFSPLIVILSPGFMGS